ncbi:MAG TPA: PKD domain-containing protein [Rudaea sp.]|nr:PKD domain-containing protein [Rudaea sp.]
MAGSFSLVAGDLDGSKNMQQEIALSYTVGGAGADSGKVRVIVLQGNGLAHFVQASNVTAGNFATTATGLLFPRLVVGDFLSQGRDQLLLAAYDQTSGAVSMDLLEFDNGTHAATVTTALPTLGNSMRGAHFASPPLNATGAKFFYDDGTFSSMQVNGGGIPLIEALEANGGDLVDTAADELVLHLMFIDPVQAKHLLAQRMFHFLTTRDANNAITSIALNTSTGFANTQSDSSIKVAAYPDPAPKFAAVIADVDAVEKKEIVTAIVGPDPILVGLGPMVWSARKAYVQNAPDFQWRNLAVNSGGLSPVVFTSTSHGAITDYQWDFGDSSGISTDKNPQHAYTNKKAYTVTLTTTDTHGQIRAVSNQVTVTGIADAGPQYSGSSPPWLYLIDPVVPVPPAPLSGTSAPDYLYPITSNVNVKISVGDMTRDGVPEVAVAVNNSGSTIDTHLFTRQQGDGSFGRSTLHDTVDTGVTAMEMVFSDFDGDAVRGVLSGAAGDCRQVSDLSVISLTWEPPFFIGPQGAAYASAVYGRTVSSSSSTDTESETAFSNSFTVGVGVSAEVSEPIVAVKTLEIDAKATLGAEFQHATGESHGDEVSYTTDKSFSIGNGTGTSSQEAVVATKTDGSTCYSYNVVVSPGVIVPGSTMRSCRATGEVGEGGYGAVEWNLLSYEAPPIQVPINWVPMQRDWASLALFHTPTYGSDPATPIAFVAGHGADQVNDGQFDTYAQSVSPVDQPYLEIDLGFVRDIQSIRVFPAADDGTPAAGKPLNFKQHNKDLWGFRLYASAKPFASGNQPPTAASSTTFVPDGVSTFVQDTASEMVYRFWNVWTVNPDGSGEPLHARYVRLQNPGTSVNRIGTGKISISEIQVFGDTHTEPQFYPEAVCDPVAGDGVFLAKVYDLVSREYTNIEVRGDIVWTGTVNSGSTVTGVTVPPDNGGTLCVNAAGVRQGPIWPGQVIDGFVDVEWNLDGDTTHTDSATTTDEWSVHAGAEFEVKAGADVMAVASAAYEFTGGVTTKSQTGTSTGTGFQLGGAVTGFPDYLASGLVYSGCAYYPRPYNFIVDNYSDVGFQQRMSVTDYVVNQQSFKGSGAWQRDALAALCSDNSNDDLIFVDHFQFGL